MSKVFDRSNNTTKNNDIITYCFDRYLIEDNSRVVLGGWCFSKQAAQVEVSVRGVEASVIRQDRKDLAEEFPAYRDNFRKSGFEIRFDQNDIKAKQLVITFSDGAEEKVLSNNRRQIYFSIMGVRAKKILFSPVNLLNNWKNALDAEKYRVQMLEQYKHHARLIPPDKVGSQEEFHRQDADIKYLAFYLPQFHPIWQNDAWWGKGFTEWRNVARALPMFVGHYQPHIPADLGYYDLRNVQTIQDQVNLARRYGIYGFCFHFYWFGGKRLLETPMNLFLDHQEIDFPFCICWANETWSRRWDGSENEILMKQDHTKEADLMFIQDAVELFKDKRYIQINGRPLLIIYRSDLFPSLKDTVSKWNAYCEAQGMPLPFVVGALTFDIADPTSYGCEAGVEFPPHGLSAWPITSKKRILNPNYHGIVFDARSIIQDKPYLSDTPFLKFRTVFPGWDNTPRKPDMSVVYDQTSPEFYKEWLKEVSEYTIINMPQDKQFVFINAWNEWAEGAHLEPDIKFGTRFLEATAEVIMELRSGNEKSD